MLSEDGELTGNPTEAGILTVQVTDSAGVKSAPFELALSWRRNCWLAYLSTEDDLNRLHFRDVFLTHDVVLPSTGTGGSVADFKFSPDGAWLAYRVLSDGQYRLEVYSTALNDDDKPRVQGVSVPFACPEGPICSVLDYAWSSDGQRIAVILGGQSEAQDYVSGVDVVALDVPWGTVGQASSEGELAPLDYRGGLVWAGSDWFALLGASAIAGFEGMLTLVTAASGGVDAPPAGLRATESINFETLDLRVVQGGVLLSTLALDDHAFFSRGPDVSGPSLDVLGFVRGRASPSGRLLGSSNEDGRLQVHAMTGSNDQFAESDRDTCARIVAWSTRNAGGRERIACVMDDALNVFDYLEAPAGAGSESRATLTPARTVRLEAPLVRAQRAFSNSGQWLIVEDPENGFWSYDLAARDPTPELMYGPGPAEMEIAPAREAVTFSGAEYLSEYPLAPPLERRSYHNNGGALATLSLCNEQGQDSWCGAPNLLNHLEYSADAESLLFEGPSPTLWLTDLSVYAPTPPTPLTALVPRCVLDCKGATYAFLP